MNRTTTVWFLAAAASAVAQIPAALSVPKPGPAASDGAYSPQTILQGGIVMPLFPANSPYLKADRVKEAEQYNMSQVVAGRISSIVNIPSCPSSTTTV